MQMRHFGGAALALAACAVYQGHGAGDVCATGAETADGEVSLLQLHSQKQQKVLAGEIVDSNVHIWDTSADYPFPKGPPPEELGTAGSVQNLTIMNVENGVSGTLIVQPINYLYDHRYVTAALENPKYCQYRGEGLLNLALGPSGVQAQMRELAAKKYVGFRYNPGLLGDGQSLDGPVSDAVAETAVELGTPIAFLFFEGLDKYSAEAEKLIARHPKTKFVIEQLGFFLQPATGQGPREIVDKAYTDLLALAKYPNVTVKAAGLYRLYQECVTELVPRFKEIYKRYGARRLMWGSDFPFVLQHGGISQSLKDIRLLLRAVDASPADEEEVLGGTVRRVFWAVADRPTQGPGGPAE